MILLFVLSLPRLSSSCAASSSASPAVTTTTIASTTTSLKTTTSTTTSTSTTTTTTTAGTCETGWTLFMGNCYYLSADTAVEPDAQEACVQRGANLVSIHSLAENTFVNMLAMGQGVWIGVIRSAPGTTTFENIDGTPLDYFNLAPQNVPNAGGTEDCWLMNFWDTTGTWEDINCAVGGAAAPHKYVCKKPAT